MNPGTSRRALLRAGSLLLAWPAAAAGQPARKDAGGPAPQRIVCLGGTATEIVFALGAGSRVVGVDQSSLYPAAATRLPQVGYYRDFSLEGVISLRPDLVVASSDAGPDQAIERLRRLGLKLVILPAQPVVTALEQSIETAAQAVHAEAAGAELIGTLRQALALPAPTAEPVDVLLLSSHSGRMQVAGSGTAADAVLRLAGGRNLVSGQSGYKPVSTETISALAPPVIVTTPLSIPTGGLAAFASLPGVAATPAARRGRIHVVDDLLLLGFGPRLPEAIDVLRAALAGEPVGRGARGTGPLLPTQARVR